MCDARLGVLEWKGPSVTNHDHEVITFLYLRTLGTSVGRRSKGCYSISQ
jgi:hypothetical protein